MTEVHPAVVVARAFIHAVVWGEHSLVWMHLSPDGRDGVLRAGSRGGLDSVMAARIRDGKSTQGELDGFLAGLVHGLRVDLSSADLEQIVVASAVVPMGDGAVRVGLESPAPFHSEPWVVGAMVLSDHDGEWLVDRLEPRLIKK